MPLVTTTPREKGPFGAWWAACVRAGPAWLVVAASGLLSLFGIAAIDVATSLTPGVTELSATAMRQAAYAVVGVCAAFLIALPNYRFLGYASWVLFGLSVALLIFLLLPFVPASIVRPRKGARGWIDLGPVDIQPVEIVKVAYVLVLAWYLRFKNTHRTILGLLPPAVLTAVPVALITLQPDLGSASLFIPVLFAVLVAAGAKLKHLAVIVLIAALAAPAAYPLLMPHQKARFVGLVKQLSGDTSADRGINMQSVTAQRLAGAGGTSGAGEERSRVLIRYNSLPERHNDMVFSVICNRWGLRGALAIFALYALWLIGAVWTAGVCREPFARLIPVGFAAFIAAQAAVNIGMNVGLLPIIGITLPFVSHGGSSMVAVWLMTGLIVSVALRQPRMALRKSFEFGED